MLPRCTTHTSCYAAVGSFGSGDDDDDDADDDGEGKNDDDDDDDDDDDVDGDDDGDDDHDVDDVVGVVDDDGDDDVDIAYEIMISLLSLFISPHTKCLKSDDSREPFRCRAPLVLTRHSLATVRTHSFCLGWLWYLWFVVPPDLMPQSKAKKPGTR